MVDTKAYPPRLRASKPKSPRKRTGRKVHAPRFHGCGVDLFATGQHSDPRMRLTLADIKAQYPWLAEIGKVFR